MVSNLIGFVAYFGLSMASERAIAEAMYSFVVALPIFILIFGPVIAYTEWSDRKERKAYLERENRRKRTG